MRFRCILTAIVWTGTNNDIRLARHWAREIEDEVRHEADRERAE